MTPGVAKYEKVKSVLADAGKRYNSGFRFTSTQKERVQDAMLENSIMDPSPTDLYKGNTPISILNLRKTDKSK